MTASVDRCHDGNEKDRRRRDREGAAGLTPFLFRIRESSSLAAGERRQLDGALEARAIGSLPGGRSSTAAAR